jgi:urease accessory protein
MKLHHAPLFGAALRALDVSLPDAQRLFLFLSLRGVISAAVRLGLAGTHEAQALQAALAPAVDEVLAACRDLGPEQIAQTAPLLDLFAATHDRLYSRLFQS